MDRTTEILLDGLRQALAKGGVQRRFRAGRMSWYGTAARQVAARRVKGSTSSVSRAPASPSLDRSYASGNRSPSRPSMRLCMIVGSMEPPRKGKSPLRALTHWLRAEPHPLLSQAILPVRRICACSARSNSGNSRGRARSLTQSRFVLGP